MYRLTSYNLFYETYIYCCLDIYQHPTELIKFMRKNMYVAVRVQTYA